MIGGTTRVRITDCRFENACDEGVYVSGRGCLGVVIERSVFSGCGKDESKPQKYGYCVGIKRGAELTVVRNNVFDDALYGIVHEAGSTPGSGQEAIPGSRSVIDRNEFRSVQIPILVDDESVIIPAN